MLGERSTPDEVADASLVVIDDMDRDDWRDWYDALPGLTRIERRDDIMIAGLRAGFTLQDMGDLHGISRERVRQIATSKGVVMRELRREQKASADRRRRRIARRVYGTSLTYPELTVAEIAEWVDTDEQTVRQALEHRLAVHETRVRPPDTGRTSEETLIAALAEWGAQTETLTGDDYTQWATDRGLPGKQTIAIRFSSWNAALVLAGLGDRIRDRGGLRPVVADEELWAAVMAFLRADLPSYSFAAFDDWTKGEGMGSGASVRNRLGEWSHVHARARSLLRYAANRDGSWPWADAVLDFDPESRPGRVATRADAVESLKRVAGRIQGPVTVAAYEEARSADDVGANMVMCRCGSWIRGLLEAGLDDRLSGKARGRLARGEVDLERVDLGEAVASSG
ncbi:hypothetical protein G7085_02830 [Tessaracoccus sp. HDW20]|uniref:hypothetical protein n=1 Tax=Tessaracoccus coleopterorum TaxID=2714950 RepID=UPI0018D48685|nr:hypothetical protein [Tessaracoccus coleopterorum]NHB83959.1 hypothetical protein [Tessaracoccus coleopterorum]